VAKKRCKNAHLTLLKRSGDEDLVVGVVFYVLVDHGPVVILAKDSFDVGVWVHVIASPVRPVGLTQLFHVGPCWTIDKNYCQVANLEDSTFVRVSEDGV
jgi:hypothetical protein